MKRRERSPSYSYPEGIALGSRSSRIAEIMEHVSQQVSLVILRETQ
jgi:hypothetical protein